MENSPIQFRDPFTRIRNARKAVIAGVAEEGFSFATLEWLMKSRDPVMVLAPTDEAAAELAADVATLATIMKRPASNPPVHLPSWDASPYLRLAPSRLVRNSRISALVRVRRGISAGIVMGPEAFLQPCASKSLIDYTFSIRPGEFNLAAFESSLIGLGYEKTEQVEDPGTFAMRGGIIDIFSPFHSYPARLELFDVSLESLRLFDPDSQRTLKGAEQIAEYTVSPCREYLCDAETLIATRARLKTWADERDIPKKSRDRIGDLLAAGIAPQELDYLLPLAAGEKNHVTTILPGSPSVLILDPDRFYRNCEKYLEQQSNKFSTTTEEDSIFLPPPDLFFSSESAKASLEQLRRIDIDPLSRVQAGEFVEFRVDPLPKFHTNEKTHTAGQKSVNIDHLVSELDRLKNSGFRTVISARSQAQFDRIGFLLSQRKIKWQRGISAELEVALVEGSLSGGFVAHSSEISVITDSDIFGLKGSHAITPAKTRPTAALLSVPDFSEGDLVVHPEHGIAVYKGIITLKSSEVQSDFALLEYADQAKLYVPVYRINILQRYSGVPGANPALDRLGTGQFEKTKQKVRAQVKDIAGALLKTQAERRIHRGFKFSPPDELFREFEGEFPYEETVDQRKAIEDTLSDMSSERPMDRLVCGDVGFGKTEVAIRAAFKAVQDGKQVAVLVPTTILAEQHFHTFKRRLSPFSVNVAVISRFHSVKEQKDRIRLAHEGKIDILIGTHRILSKDVGFKDLGLLIVDEEQRFGVEHKERLKQLRASVDVLTITATPIPRTLQLALFGLRDISVIRTPPAERIAIRTYISAFDLEIIKNAVDREIARGGQVFFIHNRVESIESVHHMLADAMPNVRIGVGHGQMSEGALEEVMLKFYRGEIDLLLATTIVENGLDVPNANTLIVNRADAFGLAQLYQIRGRVGRGKVRAHAYFLLPEGSAVTDDARQRLAILQRFNALGSGYIVATHDLELRGGGELLGQSQSGNITSVGYELYLELLDEEIARIKGLPQRPKEEELEIASSIPALLPEEYISDVRSRLQIYRRISSLPAEEDVDDARRELTDRFGVPPSEAVNLLDMLKVRIWCRRMGIKSIKIGANAVSLSARPDTTFDPQRVLLLLTLQPEKYTLTPQGSLTVKGKFIRMDQVLQSLRQLTIDAAGIQT